MTYTILHYYGNIVNTKSPFCQKIFFRKQQNTPQANRSVLPNSNKRDESRKKYNKQIPTNPVYHKVRGVSRLDFTD
nr:MAG TPA: hypothetical protein [Caudoviricetes sp.]